MNPGSRPLVILFADASCPTKLVFLGRDNPVTVKDYTAEILSVLRLCNGRATLQEIKADLPSLKDDLFEAIINLCEKEKIILDANQLYRQFHSDSSNPQVYLTELDPTALHKLVERPRVGPLGEVVAEFSFHNMTSVAKVANARKSTRSFSTDPVTAQTLAQLLGSSYSVRHIGRPTPSAGKMYPTNLHVVSADKSQPLSGWVYQFDPMTGQLVKTRRSVYPDQVARSIDHPEPPPGVVIVVSADVKTPAIKYGNRAYRYALIEAGHIAQNIALVSVEMGLSALEYGGFDERSCAEMLGFVPGEQEVLLCIVLGYQGDPTKPQFSGDYRTLLYKLKQAYEGPGKPVEASTIVPLSAGELSLPKVRAIASYREVGGHTKSRGLIKHLLHQSSGVSTSTTLAYIKALAESYERFVCGQVHWDLVESTDQLIAQGLNFVDPRIFTPYRKSQYEDGLAGLVPFDPSARIQWVIGNRLHDESQVFVPVEMVFYPVTERALSRKSFYTSTSSGVAAHTSYQEAIDSAFLELVERDAVSVLWYAKRKVFAASPETVNQSVASRIDSWQRFGWTVKLLDITLDSVPVCLAVIYSTRRFPHFVAGASAATTFASAADKALTEAETMAVSWSQVRSRKVAVTDVKTVVDHARLYFRKEGLSLVDWLVESQTCRVVHPPIELNNEMAKFDPLVVKLAVASESEPLHVVRLLSDKLLPINFGYGTEHVDHKRLEMLGLTYKQPFPSPPHFFA